MPSKKKTQLMEQISPNPILDVNKEDWQKRILIGHPMTGLVRAEWMFGRFSQTIPCNWSNINICEFMSPYIPLKYQVADAENLIAKAMIENNVEWMLFWEHDNIPPNNALVMINEYMVSGKVPVVGGIYFTKSIPAEPIVYRGHGNGYFADWHFGDKIWASGIPFGFTLIHGSIIKAMWKESPEYVVNGQVTRRVFAAPMQSWMDQEKGAFITNGGTSDLAWCKRVIDEKFFEKAGWPEYQKMQYPFLIDTNIFLRHIDQNGTMYPVEVDKRFEANGAKGREIK